MKSIYPIRLDKYTYNFWQANWESPIAPVEYLFMSHSSQSPQDDTKVDYDFRYLSIGMLKEEPQLNRISGRCS
jgi:hypothetical protein